MDLDSWPNGAEKRFYRLSKKYGEHTQHRREMSVEKTFYKDYPANLFHWEAIIWSCETFNKKSAHLAAAHAEFVSCAAVEKPLLSIGKHRDTSACPRTWSQTSSVAHHKHSPARDPVYRQICPWWWHRHRRNNGKKEIPPYESWNTVNSFPLPITSNKFLWRIEMPRLSISLSHHLLYICTIRVHVSPGCFFCRSSEGLFSLLR